MLITLLYKQTNKCQGELKSFSQSCRYKFQVVEQTSILFTEFKILRHFYIRNPRGTSGFAEVYCIQRLKKVTREK